MTTSPHRLVNRSSQDLDVATENPALTAGTAATPRVGLEARGWSDQQMKYTRWAATPRLGGRGEGGWEPRASG